jgi:hypothetical protein
LDEASADIETPDNSIQAKAINACPLLYRVYQYFSIKEQYNVNVEAEGEGEQAYSDGLALKSTWPYFWTSAIVMGLVPCALVYIGMQVLESAVGAILLFNLGACVGIPIMFTLGLSLVSSEKSTALRSELSRVFYRRCVRIRRQALLGSIAWVAFVGSGLIGYYIAKRVILSDQVLMNARAQAAEFGIDQSRASLALFSAIWFCIVNPFVEECFWRVFVAVLLRGMGGYAALLSAVLYASYHSIPVQYFAPPWVTGAVRMARALFHAFAHALSRAHTLSLSLPLLYTHAVVVVFFLVAAGAFFELVGARFGLLVAVLAHAGADAVIACAAADVVWPWL